MYKLVLGGLGFIGLNFTLYSLKRKNKVICVDNLSYSANVDYLPTLKQNKDFKFYKGNISDIKILNKIFKKYKIESIVNFAAETHVDNSISNPQIFVERNISDFVKLLTFLKSKIKKKQNFKFLHISTDEVYGSLKLKEKKFTENNKFYPNSPYSASKACAEHFLRAWGETFGFNYIIVNPSNNFGPFQNKEKFIPTIINSIIKKKKIPVYGKGLNIRDWLFVEDHCHYLYKILEKGKNKNSYNIGGDNEITNIQLVKMICKIFNTIDPSFDYFKLITFVKDRLGHDLRYGVNNNKLKKLINFKIEKDFEKKLYKTIHWYLKKNNIFFESKYD